MRLAYLTTFDASDLHNWSGAGYYIAKSLEEQGIEIDYVGSLSPRFQIIHKARKWFFLKLLHERLLIDRDPRIVKAIARRAESKLASLKVDALFSTGTIPLALLETRTPLFFWTDAVFHDMVDFYPTFRNIAKESLRNGYRMEGEALARCRLAFYSSEWAAKGAIKQFPEAKGKIRVVPFGANVDSVHTQEEVIHIIDRRSASQCHLLFSGVEWERKGGDIVLKVAALLRDQGIDVVLSLVGCQPPAPAPDYVKVYGFISKSSPQGVATLNRLLAESHFLIVPSRAEAAALVFAEASSFGVPSIACNTGGVSTVVRHGLNGEVFALDAPISAYCDYIANLLENRRQYRELAISSFNEYQTRLNWKVAGASVKALMEEVL